MSKQNTLPLTQHKKRHTQETSYRLDSGLGFLIRVADTRIGALYQRFSGQSDITPRQFGVLVTLAQNGRMTLTELAERIRVDRSTLSEMTNRMTERELICKLPNDKDRRSSEVEITATGKKAVKTISPSVVKMHAHMLQSVPEEDRDKFIAYLKLIGDAVD